MTVDEIERIIIAWHESDNQEHGKWDYKDVANRAAKAIHTKLSEESTARSVDWEQVKVMLANEFMFFKSDGKQTLEDATDDMKKKLMFRAERFIETWLKPDTKESGG